MSVAVVNLNVITAVLAVPGTKVTEGIETEDTAAPITGKLPEDTAAMAKSIDVARLKNPAT